MKFLPLSLIIGFVGAATALAQQPPAAGNAAPAARGGRGGAGAVAFTPAQAMALGAINIPPALSLATTTAGDELLRAALAMPANRANFAALAAAAANAELALCTQFASELKRIDVAALKLTSEQMQSVLANRGLVRGGNTSPGGAFAHEDYTGFTKIFDGQTLTGWSAEANTWKVDHESIHRDAGGGYIHFSGLPGVSPILRDFDLKLEMATLGNYGGGIQYRSRLLVGHGPGRTLYDPAGLADPLGRPLPAGVTTLAEATAAGITGNPWTLTGYQYDISGANTASLYEQGGGAPRADGGTGPGGARGVIVNAGEIVQLMPNGLRFVIGRASPENPMQFLKEPTGPEGEWNQVEIVARGNMMVHMLNGHIVTVIVDDDPMRRALQGVVGFQFEGARIWFRNIYLKHLEPVSSAK